MQIKRSLVIVVLQILGTLSTTAWSAEPGVGVDSQVLLVSPGQSNFVTVASSDIAAHREAMFATFVHYYREPLTSELTYPSGEQTTEHLVKDVVSWDFVWAFGFFDVMQLGLVMPVVIYQNGEGRAVEGLMPADGEEAAYALASSALGDIRLHLKTRFFGGDAPLADRRGLGLAFDVGVGIPSGDEENFAGENGFLFLPTFVVDYHKCKFSAAVNLGARLRTEKAVLGDSEVNHQGSFGLAATGHYLERRFLISGELTGLVNFPEFKQTTLEYRGAVGYVPDEDRAVTLWLSGGSAFGSAEVLGVPQFRLLFALSYVPGGGADPNI